MPPIENAGIVNPIVISCIDKILIGWFRRLCIIDHIKLLGVLILSLVVQAFDSWQCHFVALGTITPCLLRPSFPCQGFTHGLPTKGMPRIEQTARCLSRIQQSKGHSSNHATNGCFALPHRNTQAPVRQISVVAKSRAIVPGTYALVIGAKRHHDGCGADRGYCWLSSSR